MTFCVKRILLLCEKYVHSHWPILLNNLYTTREYNYQEEGNTIVSPPCHLENKGKVGYKVEYVSYLGSIKVMKVATTMRFGNLFVDDGQTDRTNHFTPH